MVLSWSHPDSELLKVKNEIFPYTVLCQNQVGQSFERRISEESVTLDNLQANTHYTCHISFAPALSEYYETAVIYFTTLGIVYKYNLINLIYYTYMHTVD